MSDYDKLSDILFTQIERISDSTLSGDDLKEQIDKAKTVQELSETYLKNSETKMKSMMLADKMGYTGYVTQEMPKLLGVQNNEE